MDNQLPTQLLKGSLEGALLAVIGEQERYAYEIHERLGQAGFGDIADGTIYPLLLKLERTGLIAGTRHPSPSGGPPRKYYQLLPAGRDSLQAFEQNWRQLALAMARVLGGEAHE